jgi:hypothetical protein
MPSYLDVSGQFMAAGHLIWQGDRVQDVGKMAWTCE